MSHTKVTAARARAQALLEHFSVRAPKDIQLEAFAKQFGAKVEFAPLDGAEAQLVRSGDRTTITLAERIKDVVAWRFNLAHEIGHLALEHPPPSNANELACNPQGWTKARGFERDASACGSELLMPEPLVRPLCEVSRVDLEVPQQIARAYTVSILASAIRFTQLTTERCAAVFCVDGKVKWCAKSARFRKPIKRGMPLDRAAVAAEYFASGEIDDQPQIIPAGAWFDTKGVDVEIVEHAVCSPKHGTTLSMLWIPDTSAATLGMRT